MKCNECEKSATFHITELTGEKPQELHLCEEHARDYLAPADEEVAATVPTLAGMLAQHLAVSQTAEDLARIDRQSCTVCGITFLEFRKQGRMGCPHDYVCFEKELEPLLISIHGGTEHTGKVPQRCPTGALQQTQLIRLRRELKEAVTAEQYEQASQLRDQIRDIEQRRGDAAEESTPE